MFNAKIREKILGGSLQDFKTHMSGMYKGYYITLHMIPGNYNYTIKISATPSRGEDLAALSVFLSQQQNFQKRLLSATTDGHVVTLTIKSTNLKKNLPEAFNEVVNPIIDYLGNMAFSSGCEHCGTLMEQIHCYNVNGTPLHLCNSCQKEIESSLQSNQEAVRSKKSNLIAGLVGAFLGSLIGCVVWVVIYQLGYIAGIAGAITAICALKGYEMLGGHLDRKGVIGSLIIMLVMVYFANRMAWTLDAYNALKDYGYTFTEIYRGLIGLIIDLDLVPSFIGELAIGYLLTIVASFRTIASAFRASSGSYTMKQDN